MVAELSGGKVNSLPHEAIAEKGLSTIGGLAMPKKFFSVLLIISLMLSLTACSAMINSKNARVIPFGRDVPELYSETDDASEEQNESAADISDSSSLLGEGGEVIGGLGGILGGMEGAGDISSLIGGLIAKEGWPSESVPGELPEYTEGEVVNSGGPADDFVILVDNTDTDALDNYMKKLKEAGWIVTMDSDDQKEAVLGLYTLHFQWNAPEFMQISIMTGKQGSWPYDELPPDLMPPEIGTLAEEISIQKHDDDSMFFVYTFDGLDGDAAADYMMMLIDNGWEGDDTFVSKVVEWKGKKYDASIEIYEIIDTRSSFSVNMWPV